MLRKTLFRFGVFAAVTSVILLATLSETPARIDPNAELLSDGEYSVTMGNVYAGKTSYKYYVTSSGFEFFTSDEYTLQSPRGVASTQIRESAIRLNKDGYYIYYDAKSWDPTAPTASLVRLTYKLNAMTATGSQVVGDRRTPVSASVDEETKIVDIGMWGHYALLSQILPNRPTQYDLKFFVPGVAEEHDINVSWRGEFSLQTRSRLIDCEKFVLNYGNVALINLWRNDKKKLILLTVPAKGVVIALKGFERIPLPVNRKEDPALTSVPVTYMHEEEYIDFKEVTGPDGAVEFKPFKAKRPVYVGGTLTYPKDAKALDKSGKGLPAVIIVSDKERQDRDGNSPRVGLKWNNLRDIAEAAARAGFVTLRYDDRGVGKSVPPFRRPGSSGKTYVVNFDRTGVRDFVADLKAGYDFLRKQDSVKIDPRKIGIIGYGEGGVIGALLALESPDSIAYMAFLATSPVNYVELQVLNDTEGYWENEKLWGKRRVADEIEKARDYWFSEEEIEITRIDQNGKEYKTKRKVGLLKREIEYIKNNDNLLWYYEHSLVEPAKTAAELDAQLLILQPQLDKQVYPDLAGKWKNAFGIKGKDVISEKEEEPVYSEHIARNGRVTYVLFGHIDHLLMPSRGYLYEYGDERRKTDARFLEYLVSWLKRTAQ